MKRSILVLIEQVLAIVVMISVVVFMFIGYVDSWLFVLLVVLYLVLCSLHRNESDNEKIIKKLEDIEKKL